MTRKATITAIAVLAALTAAGPLTYAGKAAKKSVKTETSADLKRRQDATQKEIRQTQAQIKANDAEVKKNLNELGKLAGDIGEGKKKVTAASNRVNVLEKQIGATKSRIAAEEKSLEKIRAEYLKAVKKMRARRKEKSMLAFIFSSSSFNEAMRRMRYLREFSDWRERQNEEIGRRVASLKAQNHKLAQTKTMHDRALAESVKAQKHLQDQYARQDAIVVELKKNGQALHAHLSKKQAEVNALKGRVAALIAEEQRKEEAARKARAAEQERLHAEAERKAAEEQKRREAELLARNEARAREEAARTEKAEKEAPAKNTPKKETAPQKNTSKKEVSASKGNSKKQTAAPKPTAKKATPSKEVKGSGAGSGNEVSYAEARRRKPRSSGEAPAAGEAASVRRPEKAGSGSSGGGFAGMKGSLPRPVAGSFKVTSRFGRNALPDMPDVVYDNPGIDAEVGAGASVQAVYAGKVSGVYVVPGYSTVVIVSHDGYYTVYGNIARASVKVGDAVRQGQVLGKVAADEDDPSHGLVHFEVWKNRDKMDPMGWIR